MRRCLPLLVLASVFLAACGKTTPTQTITIKTPPPAEFVCVHKVPAQLGECIREQLQHEGKTPARPKFNTTFGARVSTPQCIDISRWQGIPDFRALHADGIKCVLIQGADGDAQSNPYIGAQVAGARSVGMPYGFYLFAEQQASASQANALGESAAGRGGTLGVWVDNEVPGSYEHACGIAERLRTRWGYRIVGDYGSPGLVPSWVDQCDLYSWPAEWGGGAPAALPGFPASSLKIRQWCGTCSLPGISGQVDRDEALGILQLAVPPKPKPKPLTGKQKRKLLAYEITRRGHERGFLTAHHCRQPPWRYASPSGRWEHACHVEIRHGKITNHIIRDLSR